MASVCGFWLRIQDRLPSTLHYLLISGRKTIMTKRQRTITAIEKDCGGHLA